MDERFIGKLVKFDPIKRHLTVRVDFLDPEKQEIIEKIIQEQNDISFNFSKPFRRLKTYAQLKTYYRDLSIILTKLDIDPISENVRALDEEIKKSIFPCQFLEVWGERIPLVPSKANMTTDQMSEMIRYVKEHYAKLLDEQY